MKLVVEYPAMIWSGNLEDIGELVKFVNSMWELSLNIHAEENGYAVSFYYPNNEDRVLVRPGRLLYKGSFGAFYAADPDTLVDARVVD